MNEQTPYIAMALLRRAWQVDQEVTKGEMAIVGRYATEACPFPVSTEAATEALNILDRCGIASISSDKFAGDFFRIDYNELKKFVEEARAQKAMLERETYSGRTTEPQARADPDFRKHFLLQEMPQFALYSDFGDEWLGKALENVARSNDPELEDFALPAISVPTAGAFVTVHHNSEQAAEIISVVEAADEGVRTSNAIEEEQRGWIRIHLAAGRELITKGGALLKSALKSLILEPLKAALNSVTEEHAKTAIMAAIRLIWGLIK
ncbi:MAG: hypothetical protein K2W81_15155 [Sphingomonas sp.]|uniref:hypothetical protein n=1 Tax=Sphingomonas sp. TaxID=28214 RepID=UPI0025F3EDB1|nr:hypothetical protein [Sphingomonas sp.]MBY0285286.1 hypothetical protein [Sphingomonas sp.]